MKKVVVWPTSQEKQLASSSLGFGVQGLGFRGLGIRGLGFRD